MLVSPAINSKEILYRSGSIGSIIYLLSSLEIANEMRKTIAERRLNEKIEKLHKDNFHLNRMTTTATENNELQTNIYSHLLVDALLNLMQDLYPRKGCLSGCEARGDAIHILYIYSNPKSSSNHVFVVELDTSRTSSSTTSTTTTSAYFAWSSKIDLNLKSGKPIVAVIDYDSGMNIVNITLSPSSTKPLSLLLSDRIDLSLILHETMFIRF
ncbi:concanavalin A-like lectin protein kinase family protein [Striga asiatica]|uniref:Concanavalin A-like lectin protein kinase family protein n=1 Tax=Striga asiatica TaxID=4170 RepID=A0A5A7QBP5_STRAF|nr:concanavalin A-like lectin protein kinase family protein [Striga asiatica]